MGSRDRGGALGLRLLLITSFAFIPGWVLLVLATGWCANSAQVDRHCGVQRHARLDPPGWRCSCRRSLPLSCGASRMRAAARTSPPRRRRLLPSSSSCHATMVTFLELIAPALHWWLRSRSPHADRGGRVGAQCMAGVRATISRTATFRHPSRGRVPRRLSDHCLAVWCCRLQRRTGIGVPFCLRPGCTSNAADIRA